MQTHQTPKIKLFQPETNIIVELYVSVSHGGSFPSNLSDGDAGWNIAIQFDDIYDNDTDNELRI